MLRPRRAGLDFGFTGEGWPLESVLRVWALGSDSEGVSQAPGNNGVRLASESAVRHRSRGNPALRRRIRASLAGQPLRSLRRLLWEAACVLPPEYPPLLEPAGLRSPALESLDRRKPPGAPRLP